MKKQITIAFIFAFIISPAALVLPAFTSGCATLEDGHRSTVVRAEAMADMLVESLDLLFKLDYEFADQIDRNPELKAAINDARRVSPGVIRDLREATKAFKAAEQGGEAKLNFALSTAASLLARAQSMITQTKATQ